LKWVNTVDMPHNVIGVYKTLSGKQIPIDSGFMQKGNSWKYTFAEEGTMEYYCTTHSEDGMKGSLIVSK
jgi:plastocyanin